MTITDYPDYQTPQAHADTISNTGVPLLSRPANVVNQSGTVVSGATATVALNQPISKIGYEIMCSVFAPATNQSLITVQMVWSDSVSGQTVVTEEWDFYAGSGPLANAHIIRGTGPTKGDTLTVKLSQSISTVTATYQVVMAQNSRVYSRDDWRSTTYPPVTGFTSIFNSDLINGVLGTADSLAVAAAGSVTYLLPLFSGKVAVNCITASNAADCSTIIHSPAAAFGSLTFDQIFGGRTDASGRLYIPQIALPRAQCTVQQINSNAAAKDLFVSLLATDY